MSTGEHHIDKGIAIAGSDQSTTSLDERQVRRVLWTAVVGTVIEWYDFVLFAVASGIVFNKLFFSSLSPTGGTLASYAVLAVGFLARPLGGLVISHFGDKNGRKPALIFTVTLMGAATFAIGCLPTDAQIGILAPILLIVLRLLQGLGAGAEYAGALILVAESVPAKRKGYYTAFILSSTVVGLLLGSLIFRLLSQLPEEALLGWAWRIPFLLSAALLVVAIYIRNKLEETPEFAAAMARSEEKTADAIPLKAVLQKQPKTLFLGYMSTWGPNATTYVINTFVLGYMINNLAFTRTESLNILILASLAGVICTPIMGALSDRFGYANVHALGNVFMLLYTGPMFLLLDSKNLYLAAIAMIIGYGIGFGSIAGSQGAFLANLFPTKYRFSGIAFVREISGATVAATTPFLAAWLTLQAGGKSTYVVAYLILFCIISTLAILALRRTPPAVDQDF